MNGQLGAYDFDALDEALMEGVEEGITEAGDTVATASRADHPYKDRTGRLTAATEGLTARREGDVVRGGAVAVREYASRLEERPEYAFLAPAYGRSEARIEHDLDTCIGRKVNRR